MPSTVNVPIIVSSAFQADAWQRFAVIRKPRCKLVRRHSKKSAADAWRQPCQPSVTPDKDTINRYRPVFSPPCTPDVPYKGGKKLVFWGLAQNLKDLYLWKIFAASRRNPVPYKGGNKLIDFGWWYTVTNDLTRPVELSQCDKKSRKWSS